MPSRAEGSRGGIYDLRFTIYERRRSERVNRKSPIVNPCPARPYAASRRNQPGSDGSDLGADRRNLGADCRNLGANCSHLRANGRHLRANGDKPRANYRKPSAFHDALSSFSRAARPQMRQTTGQRQPKSGQRRQSWQWLTLAVSGAGPSAFGCKQNAAAGIHSTALVSYRKSHSRITECCRPKSYLYPR